jgi:MoxR-like ATPase
MPSDILGSEILDENRQFKFIKGPVFSTLFWQMKSTEHRPKAVQERSVTIAGENYKLDLPYFVLATQNPIEQGVLILCLRPSWIVLCYQARIPCRRSSGVKQTNKNTINSLFTAQEIRFSAIDS